MLTLILCIVCVLAGGAGGYLLGAKVKAKAEAVIDAVKK